MSRPFLEISYTVQTGLNWVSQGVGDTTSKYLNLISIKKNNKNLLTKISQLKLENADYQELKLENIRLKNMLALKDKSEMSLIAASVIAEDSLSENQTLTVNKGLRHGIKVGMGVLGLNGIIGEVLKTARSNAQILILTDRFFVTEGLIQRSRKKIILEGGGDRTLISNHIDNDMDVQVGDLIVTSGAEEAFPKGLPVGTVKSLKVSNAGITKSIQIQPLTDLLNAEELFIISNPGNYEED